MAEEEKHGAGDPTANDTFQVVVRVQVRPGQGQVEQRRRELDGRKTWRETLDMMKSSSTVIAEKCGEITSIMYSCDEFGDMNCDAEDLTREAHREHGGAHEVRSVARGRRI